MTKKVKLSQYIVNWCNEKSPRSEGENLVIQYGLQLFISSFIKMILLLIIGACIHRLQETLIVMAVFCTLRLQAGGKHAKTEFGCMACTFGIWLVSLVVGNFFVISDMLLLICYFMSVGVIVRYAPKSVNSTLFTDKMKWQKRFCTMLLLSVYFIISFVSHDLRGYIVCPAVIEVLSLLPIFKDKGGEQI